MNSITANPKVLKLQKFTFTQGGNKSDLSNAGTQSVYNILQVIIEMNWCSISIAN